MVDANVAHKGSTEVAWGTSPHMRRSGKDLLTRWFSGLQTRNRASLFEMLDSALVDAPSLCCDSDGLCAACEAESAPWLTGRVHLDPAVS
jgi:hypothetical protein